MIKIGGGVVFKNYFIFLCHLPPSTRRRSKRGRRRVTRGAVKKEKGKKKGNNTVTEPIWSSLFVRKHR